MTYFEMNVCYVATVLTACGIETGHIVPKIIGIWDVATVLTACGIETASAISNVHNHGFVATVLTACGIETTFNFTQIKSFIELQQYLPLAVLKLERY